MNSDELENQQQPGCLYLEALMKRQKGGPEDDARENLVDRGMKENPLWTWEDILHMSLSVCNEPNWLDLHVERSHVMG